MDDGARARRDVHHLEVAADVVAIGHPARLGRHDDADVAERRRLLDRGVVRAGEQADVDVGTEIGAVELGVHHRLAEPGDAHDEPSSFALQLEDVGALDGRLDRRRHAAGHLPVLQRGEAVAVQHGVDVGRIGLEALADDHPDLAVRVGAGADELHVRADEEIAAHLPPRELEFVARGPHVGAAGGQRVGLGAGVVGGGALDGRRPEIRRRFEVADGRSDCRRRRVVHRRRGRGRRGLRMRAIEASGPMPSAAASAAPALASATQSRALTSRPPSAWSRGPPS